MSEFEKWWNEELTKTEKGYCMIAWRAALEMVQDWYKEARDGFDLGLLDMIKKELDGTSEKRC